jgi:hypothetical protein
MHLKIYLKLFLRRSFFCRVLSAAEGTFCGGNSRAKYPTNGTTLIIMDRVQRNSVVAHPHLMSLQEATGVYHAM